MPIHDTYDYFFHVDPSTGFNASYSNGERHRFQPTCLKWVEGDLLNYLFSINQLKMTGIKKELLQQQMPILDELMWVQSVYQQVLLTNHWLIHEVLQQGESALHLVVKIPHLIDELH